MPAPAFRLYLVTDRRATAGRPLAVVLDACLGAGLPALQLREKDLPAGELVRLASDLRARTGRHGARLLVNDRVDVALAVGADGVHLPATGLPPAAARRLIGPARLIGVSTHAATEVEAAAAGGADFAVFGPVYETPSKRTDGEPQGLDRLAAACRRSVLPVLAIGGVTAERVGEVRAAGAAGVAVIRALLGADDPARATKDLLAACERAWPVTGLASRGPAADCCSRATIG
jgi:thiamine-phosphate pyrophosphorylase